MEVLKWAAATFVALVVALAGIALAITAVVVSTIVKLLGFLVILAGVITVVIKEAIDSRSSK